MRFKSVLAAISFIFLASFIALLIFVHTKSFGSLVTRVISDIGQKKADTTVSIKKIGISLFPPGIELDQVRITKNFNPEKKLHAEFGKLGLYVNFIELEERQLTLGEVRFSDSSIVVQLPPDENEKPEVIEQQVIDDIFKMSKKTPIRIDSVLVENSLLTVNHDLLEMKRLKVVRRADKFLTKFHLANVKPLANQPYKVDELWGEVIIGRQNLEIQRLKVLHDVHSVILKGGIQDYRLLKGAQAQLTGEASIHLKRVEDLFALPEKININSGQALTNFSLAYNHSELSGSIGMVVHNLRSNLVYADELRMELTLNDRALMLEKLSLDYQKQHLKLLAKKKVYDIRTSQLVLDDLKVELTNFSLNNVLRFLGPALKPLKGRLSGNVSVNFKKGNFYFRPENGFRINKLGLVVGDPGSPFQILMVKEGKLNSSEFRIVDSEFQMESKIALKSSVLDISGKINSKGVKFNAGRASVDLEDFGNISNLDIIGQGMLDIDVAGSFDDTVIRLTGPLSNFGVLGYKLGDALVDIAIDLKDSTVRINKLESEYGTTPISGTGSINWSNQDIALGILSSHASYRDLAHILHPIFSKLGFLPSDLDFDAKVDTDIFGKYTLPKLKINARTKIQNIKAYGESIDNAELTVRLADGTLHLAQFHGIKGKGRIDGDFSYVLDTNHFLMNYAWDNLSLTAFNAVKNLNLNLKGKLSGGVKGGGKSDNYKLTLQSRLYDTHSSDFSFADSEIALKIRPSLLSGSTKIMNSVLLSNFEIALDKKYRSKIKIDLNLPDIKPVAVAILGQHIMNEKISGSYYLNIDTSFSHGFTDVDLFLKLSQMTFQHESFSVNYLSDSPQFLIDNSRIKKWDFSIREPDLLFVTNGEGEFGKNVSLIHEFHVNSKILELLFAPVLSAEGFVRNIIRVDGVGNNYVLSATSKTNNLDLTIDEVPFPLNDINFHLDFNQNRLLVQNFSTALENGSVALKGDIYFDDNEPDINLKFLLDKAEIPILGKSIINLSGEGIILGNKMPYGLSGEIIVNKAQIINELNEFNTKSSALNQVRFLPKNQESPFGKIFNLNLNVKAENPIKISNSLMDVGLKGELVLLGNPVRPRAEGRLYAPVNSSRVFFKNNEYFITNADLNFNPKKDISNPDFDVQAYTFISNYKVSAKAYGDLERFNFDLTSDPVLPRSSILSLIAFGYTDEIQSTLTSGEQQNLTQVGVGSFVFDRFKITDILNKQFGLQVNLGTVFEQSQTESLLAGRSQESQGTLGRTRSATKIELKKKLDEALNLSVSSTMGGSIGQRQSMNLTYNLNKKVQLEGVYELRTNAEGEEDIIDNSIGGDLKFRWTFK